MKPFSSAFSLQPSALKKWLPDMDLNHDKQIQSLLCYRYTIGQAGASGRLENFSGQSSRQTFINTGLQSGGPRARQISNRFNGLTDFEETVETVSSCGAFFTGLKPGVNENFHSTLC